MGMHQALKKAHLSPPATGCQPSWAGSGIPRIPRPVWLWVQTGLRRCRGKLGRRRGPAALLCSEGWGGSRMWPLSCCLPLLGRRSTAPPAPSSSAAPAGSLPSPSPMPGPVTSVAQGTFSPAGHPRHQSCMEHRLGFQSPWQTPADQMLFSLFFCSLPSHPRPLPRAWIHPALRLDSANFLFSVWLLNLILWHKQGTCDASEYSKGITENTLHTTPP